MSDKVVGNVGNTSHVVSGFVVGNSWNIHSAPCSCCFRAGRKLVLFKARGRFQMVCLCVGESACVELQIYHGTTLGGGPYSSVFCGNHLGGVK